MKHGMLIGSVLALGAVLSLVGCSSGDADTQPVNATQTDNEQMKGATHDLHGYWCIEHSVPEEICAQCDPKLAVEFQEKGDWCDEHNRPDSQCFIHHPEFAAQFAAQYEAKFGELPPKSELE